MSTDTAWKVVHVLMGLAFATAVVRANPGPLGWFVVVAVAVVLLVAWAAAVRRR